MWLSLQGWATALRSRLGSLLLFTVDALSPTSEYLRPTVLHAAGSVCMQDRKGLRHCLHKIQSLTISKAAVGPASAEFSPVLSCKGTYTPHIPSSQARNLSPTGGCHHLITTATQPTLKSNQKNNTLSLHDMFFSLPHFGYYFEWLSNNLKQKIKKLEWSAGGRQNNSWALFPF